MGVGGSASPTPALAALALRLVLDGTRSVVAAWACRAGMALLVTASIGMPGDGNQAMQATRSLVVVTLVAGALVTGGGP